MQHDETRSFERQNAVGKDSTEILDIIHEVRDRVNHEENMSGMKKMSKKDKHFEVFKEYNKKLLSFPVVNDPFMARKRQQYKKSNAGPTVFDRLTGQKPASDDAISTNGLKKVSS